ncbi:MAG: hypothetical protein EBW49_08625 [Betaproteobacteria bacterium]|nr:hypothetical protein [Betaproteobacteria bacterium]
MSLRDEANHEQELEALRAALRRAQAQLAKATTGNRMLVAAVYRAAKDSAIAYVPPKPPAKSASKAGAELLFDVIATAYERNSLVVTTNLPFENWTEVLGSERLTGAALDRLTHRCHILETKGESYRLQDAKRRRRRAD